MNISKQLFWTSIISVSLLSIIFLFIPQQIDYHSIGNIPTHHSQHFCAFENNIHSHETQAFETKYQEHISQMNSYTRTNHTLPVAVHIIHNNGAENISDAQVLQGINHLNQAFENISYYNQGTGVDTEIQFCLAQQNPSGNATTGITRNVSSLTNMVQQTDDITVKNINRWNPLDYINIWVVNEITSLSSGSGVVGYASFPTSHGTNVDGIMMEASFLGSSASASSVLVHEMGHYLGLYHTFQGGCMNNNCLSDGDRVCDTPPDQSTAAVPCSSSPNSCTTDSNSGFASDQNDMFWNYMDYGDLNCYSAFSQGQADRMDFSIINTRTSLLSSIGCIGPCTIPISADFTASSTQINVGGTVSFSNNSINANSYDWQVNGVSFSNSQDANYTFPLEGIYEITLVSNNSDPNCLADSYSISIDVSCPVTANFTTNTSTDISINDVVIFNNNSINANSYQWFVDNVLISTDFNYNQVFDNLGTYEVTLVATDGLCSEIFSTIITVSNTGLAQTGLPIWPTLNDIGDFVATVDWRDISPNVTTLADLDNSTWGQTGVAFDECGEIAFIVTHYGSSSPNSLFIFDKDGVPLLTNNTANAPGLNAVRGGNEIQVVKVPQTPNEWYIIYNEWSTDSGAPLNNAAYNAARCLYSRVQLSSTGELNVLSRDVVLTNNGGTAYTYTDGKAVSRTANGNSNAHYLYACRRSVGNNTISLDRFLINNSGITFSANTGNVNAPYWTWTNAGSPIELSPLENKIAVINRNQSSNYDDIFIFDANAFNNVNYESITGGDLILVPDGTPNDLSNVLPYPGSMNNLASNTSLPLRFLSNFDKKLSSIEFSPNGRFLYITSGGFTGSGSNAYLTYLAQIDLETPAPHEVRLQIQTTPNNSYNQLSGLGCPQSQGSCWDDWASVFFIQSSFDGNLYFTKRNGDTFYVIPNPNNFMPQNLIPSNIDLSTASEPNITSLGRVVYMPDQIDGYNYLGNESEEVSIYVSKTDCFGNCIVPYDLAITVDGFTIETFQINQCPDTITLCLNTTFDYDLETPNIIFTDAVTDGNVNYPGGNIFDLSENPNCEELCDNGIDDDGDGLIDCLDTDLQDSCCCFVPSLILDLGPDVSVCNNGVHTFDSGGGFTSYQWQDGSTDATFTAFEAGIYWLDAYDECGNVYTDTVLLAFDNSNTFDLGGNQFICPGSSTTISAPNFDKYEWIPNTDLDCDNCQTVTASPLQPTTYTLIATDINGCISTDSISIVPTSVIPIFDTVRICAGDSILIFDSYESQEDTYTDTIFSTTSCDSALITYLEVIAPIQADAFISNICGNNLGSIQLNISNGLPPYSIEWSNADTTASISNLNQGTYTVSIYDDYGCMFTDSYSITEYIFEVPEINIENITCLGNTDGLVYWENPNSYLFSLDSINFYVTDSFPNLAEGNYTLFAIDSSGCTDQIDFSIGNDFPELIVTLPADTLICLGESVIINTQLNHLGNFTYEWSPTDGLDCTNCPNPIATPLISTTYTLTVHYGEDCVAFEDILIQINNEPKIYIPNAFTPNGDGFNDILTIYSSDGVSEVLSFKIFSRWGELVYANYGFPTNSLDIGWDGTLNGQPMNNAVFVYIAEIVMLDGSTHFFKGNVTLMR